MNEMYEEERDTALLTFARQQRLQWFNHRM